MTERKLTATLVSLFPEAVQAFLSTSVLGKALARGCFQINAINLRDFSTDNYKSVDDTPCGGGPGQLMRIDIVKSALDSVIANPSAKRRVILTDPAGPAFTAQDAQRLAQYEELIFVCGRYEGIDSRIYHYVDESFSIGDFVLTSGELAATVMLDATLRFVPAVLGNAASVDAESHASGLLEHSQYTRPIEFDGHQVPQWLLSGNHAKIALGRRAEQLVRTQKVRPDLFAHLELNEEDRKLLRQAEDFGPYPWDREPQ
jgi:tRNA (guanine37-N1)-methyltransferase